MNRPRAINLVARPLGFSPAYLAFLILFGLLLAFALVSFFKTEWSPVITVSVYMVALAGVVFLAWQRRNSLSRPNRFDLLLALFIIIIIISTVIHGPVSNLIRRPIHYLPFLVIAPYLCGRLMSRADIELFAYLVKFVGLGILPILVWDNYISPTPIGRHTYFEVDHAALLIANLLAFTLLSVATRGVDNSAWRTLSPTWRSAIRYSAMGLLVGFIVWVSARGWVIAILFGFIALLLASIHIRDFRRVFSKQLVFVLAMVMSVVTVIKLTHENDIYTKGAQSLVNELWLAKGSSRLNRGESLPVENWLNAGLSQPAPTGNSKQIKPAETLTPDSCQILEEGMDSIKIRAVLYREAIEQFVQFPIGGRGAGLFGAGSCIGIGGYPHSTILQALAELGLIGGLPLIALYMMGVFYLFKVMTRGDRSDKVSTLFLLSCLIMLVVTDQIYGSYFMASGTYFLLGVTSSVYDRMLPSKRIDS